MKDTLVPLPDLNIPISGLKPGVTRWNIVDKYNASDDEIVRQILENSKLFLDKEEILALGADYIVMPSLAPLELAAIIYFDCMKDNNPIKKDYSKEYVASCLQEARNYHSRQDLSYLE